MARQTYYASSLNVFLTNVRNRRKLPHNWFKKKYECTQVWSSQTPCTGLKVNDNVNMFRTIAADVLMFMFTLHILLL